MGGQACVFYGAAEFSRDLDLLILADSDNLAHLHSALADLGAEEIAVPSFDARLLARGHAVHFRCNREDVAELRIDIMSSLRGVAAFEELWQRRTTIETEGQEVDMLSIEDLVRAKKTQRDKDWPMIRRLVEQSYFGAAVPPPRALVDFWLRELRTPELLLAVASAHPDAATNLVPARLAIAAALRGDVPATNEALGAEEREERRKDREYWEPLKRELEELRRARGPGPPR
jgi:hypothetical protein